jgi:hypothetical protein
MAEMVLTTKSARLNLLSRENIVELVLPVALGILAAWMRLASLNRTGMGHIFSSFRAAKTRSVLRPTP